MIWGRKVDKEAQEALKTSQKDLGEAQCIKKEAVGLANALRRIEKRNHLAAAIEFQFRGGRA